MASGELGFDLNTVLVFVCFAHPQPVPSIPIVAHKCSSQMLGTSHLQCTFVCHTDCTLFSSFLHGRPLRCESGSDGLVKHFSTQALVCIHRVLVCGCAVASHREPVCFALWPRLLPEVSHGLSTSKLARGGLAISAYDSACLTCAVLAPCWKYNLSSEVDG
jgi:hypothetical protein